MNSVLGIPPLMALLYAAVAVLLVLGVSLSRKGGRASYRRGRFLSANEKCFLGALDAALGGGYRVFAQVRLAELVVVDGSSSDARKSAALKKVFGKSSDFVICSARTFDPIAAIEVDDRTHLLPARRERDVFVNAVFQEIGMPLLRVTAKRNYSVDVLRNMLVGAGVREERNRI